MSWWNVFRKSKKPKPEPFDTKTLKRGRVVAGGWAIACWSGIPATCTKWRVLLTVSHLRPIPKRGLSPYRSFDQATHEWYIWLCSPDGKTNEKSLALHYQTDLGDWYLQQGYQQGKRGDWESMLRTERQIDSCAIAVSTRAAEILGRLPCYTLENQKQLFKKFEQIIEAEYRKCPHFKAAAPLQILLKDGRASVDGRED